MAVSFFGKVTIPFLAYLLVEVTGEKQYGGLGGKITLTPKVSGQPEDILWKHNGNKVVEFDGSQNVEYGGYKGRTILVWDSGALTISGLTDADSGPYELEAVVKGKLQYSQHEVGVIDDVAQPSITCVVDNTTPENMDRTLLCSADLQPLTQFIWRSPGGSEIPGPELFIPGGENQESVYTCVVKNPVSERTAVFILNDCYTEEGSFSVLAVVLSVVLSILLLLVLVAILAFLLWCRKKDKKSAEAALKKSEEEAGLIEVTVQGNVKEQVERLNKQDADGNRKQLTAPARIISSPTKSGVHSSLDRQNDRLSDKQTEPVQDNPTPTQPEPVTPESTPTQPEPVTPESTPTQPEPVTPESTPTQPEPVTPESTLTQPHPGTQEPTPTQPHPGTQESTPTQPHIGTTKPEEVQLGTNTPTPKGVLLNAETEQPNQDIEHKKTQIDLHTPGLKQENKLDQESDEPQEKMTNLYTGNAAEAALKKSEEEAGLIEVTVQGNKDPEGRSDEHGVQDTETCREKAEQGRQVYAKSKVDVGKNRETNHNQRGWKEGKEKVVPDSKRVGEDLGANVGEMDNQTGDEDKEVGIDGENGKDHRQKQGGEDIEMERRRGNDAKPEIKNEEERTVHSRPQKQEPDKSSHTGGQPGRPAGGVDRKMKRENEEVIKGTEEVIKRLREKKDERRNENRDGKMDHRGMVANTEDEGGNEVDMEVEGIEQAEPDTEKEGDNTNQTSTQSDEEMDETPITDPNEFLMD